MLSKNENAMKQFVFTSASGEEAKEAEEPRPETTSKPRPFKVSQAYIQDVMEKIGIAQKAVERVYDQQKKHFESRHPSRLRGTEQSNSSYSQLNEVRDEINNE